MCLPFRLAGSPVVAWFVAASLLVTARASQVVVTITGTVRSGTDTTGVFGAPNTDLTGKPYTVIFTYDDTKGTQSTATCPDGTPYYSLINATSSSSPGTATLSIGGSAPFPIGGGAFGQTDVDASYALMYGVASCYSYSAAGYGVQVSYGNGGYYGTSYVGYFSGPGFMPATGTQLTTPANWEAPIFGAPLNTGDVFPFLIYVVYNRNSLASASGNLSEGTLSVSGPLDTNGEMLGCGCVGTMFKADPINTATGNLFEKVTDYTTSGANPLSLMRYYNSKGNSINLAALQITSFAVSAGTNWRSNYDRYLQITPSFVSTERPDGQVLGFTLTGGIWTPNTDIDTKLTQAGSSWRLTDASDTVETYTVATANIGGLAVPYGQLSSIQARNGYTQTLAYNGSNQLISVTDSYNRALNMAYSNGLVQTVTTPDGLTLTYAYSASGLNGSSLDRLASVSYSTSPVSSQSYLYENASFPFALTGIIDENGNRFATWAYDSLGRATSSQHAGGADLTTITYDDTTGNRTVTNALGEQELYKFTTLQGVPKVSEIDRLASVTTAAATRKFTYDANGYMASVTDWNGNLTTFVNDVHGQPTTMVEASGTAQTRTTTTAYHAIYHLPLSIATPGLTTTFAYDASGDLLTKTLADTTATVVPYSTNGTSRSWTYTWANFLLASAKGPRTDVVQLTSFTYDASGALTKTTNALGQVTKITAHSGGGLPETIVDPNGVTTNLTYDTRQRLLTSTLSTSAGPLTTTLAYDAAGNLVKTTLPDGSTLTNSYDAAHRLMGVTDRFGQRTAYTLDALGDRTLATVLDAGGTTQRKHSATFDALGRILQDIGGVGQTTGYAYDSNGNALTITDPLGHVAQQAFDPLNRLIRTIDAAGGITKTTYDAHDRPVTVVDPNSGSTTFVYDGFGDVIQRISPDSGKTVYRYDLAGNLLQSVDATGATANSSYDALNRPLTRTFPADGAENVTYAYDQAGHGFGIGRLTSVADAAGTLSRSYDERGNVLSEKRIHGAATLSTSYAYDAASRVASISYPSGWIVAYTRDIMGRITAATAKPTAGAPQSIVSGIAHQPFGPVSALTYGNGVAEGRGFDLDYRLLHLTDAGSAALQNLTYGYDAANNVSSITDGVTAGNTQNLGYDVLDRLTSATGSYGSLGYTYSAIGNRLTQTSGGVTTNYTYAPHSNQLASIKTGAVTQAVGTTATGNISSFAPAFGPVTSLTYNQANRLATASAGTAPLTQYTYDAFGQRIVKAGSLTATTLYQYDRAGHLLEELDGFGNPAVDYIYLGDRPIATISPLAGKIYFLQTERLGTPQLATDASQSIAWATTYQPFGATGTIFPDVIAQDLRLPGQESDLETGLYHNGFRDYIPALGRYIQSDPIGLAGGMNTFQYANGNALKFVDPKGTAGANLPITFLVFKYIESRVEGAIEAEGWGEHPVCAQALTGLLVGLFAPEEIAALYVADVVYNTVQDYFNEIPAAH